MIHHTFFKPVVILLAVAIPAWFIARSAFRRKTTGIDISFSREFKLFLCYLYFIAVAAITLVPLSYSTNRTPAEGDLNLVPFRTILNGLRHDLHHEKLTLSMLMQNTAGNILLFIPFGFLLPMVIRKMNAVTAVFFWGMCFSLFIEAAQYAERSVGIYRSSDIDDVILNTLGALVGWWILCGLRWFGGLFRER